VKVIILRGLPGCGKSTWAKAQDGAAICSADEFLYDDEGKYVWTPERLNRAHALCHARFIQFLDNVDPLIIVDNCNLTNRDMKFYVQQAEDHGYDIEIRTFLVDPGVAMKRQLHGVPPEKYPLLVQRLLMPVRPDWEKYLVGS
jgi:predicted kinase